MSKPSSKVSNTRMMLERKKKLMERKTGTKPFGFCCSLDRFDSLARYDQRMPPYKSSLTAITSVHECPVAKMQMVYLLPRHSRERKKATKIKASEIRNQQLSRNDEKNFHIGRNDDFIKWYLEDEVTLARDIFWTNKQRTYNEESYKAIIVAKEKEKARDIPKPYPRWYQDFSPDQMKNLENLENVMRIDNERTITSGTQTVLMAMGVTSTFFKLEPNIIKELHASSSLNSLRFLREVYKLLTGNDFQDEGYKKFYDCNERIILSAIAFLTLPETVETLHKRLPAVILPRLSLKPKPPSCLTRKRNICPYKEELFKHPDWASYRNDLQKWRKRYKLIAIPKVILPFKGCSESFASNEMLEKNKRRSKDIYAKHLEATKVKNLQTISASKSDRKDVLNIVSQVRDENKTLSIEENANEEKSVDFDTLRLPYEDKFDFTIADLDGKSRLEYKTCDKLRPPGTSKKSWLGEKEARYVIAGASEESSTCPVTYAITGVAKVTPSNSDEKFFAVLKLDDESKKIFPSGKENLSRKWQEWLQNADEDFRQVEKKANELLESAQTITRSMFQPTCDKCCLCRQTRKAREEMRRTKTPHQLIDGVIQDGNEKRYIIRTMAMHSPELSPEESMVNLLEMETSRDEIKTNIVISGVSEENGITQYHVSGIQKEKIHIPESERVPEPSTLQKSVKKVPPCACAIRQIFNKDFESLHRSPSACKDDIPWTKDGLCIGKKYRPDKPSAYYCEMFPSDKSCRRNPFMKEISKIEKEKREEKIENQAEKVESAEAKEEVSSLEIQVSNQKVVKKKGDRFIPDPDYPAYDDPWNLSRTAQSEVLEAEYEKTLKLTYPVLPVTSSPLRVRERRKPVPRKKLMEPSDSLMAEKTDSKVSSKISSRLLKTVRKQRRKGKRPARYIRKKKSTREPLHKITTFKKDAKSTSKTSKFPPMGMTKKPRTKLLPADRLTKRKTDKIHKMRKRDSAKKDKKKQEEMDKVDQLEARKKEMARLKTMLTSGGVLGDIQPVVLPEEQLVMRPPEIEETFKIDSSVEEEESSETAKKDPCGWRTKSEQELPAKKTIAYLCEPDYPLETIPVRPGGRPCQCRENRNKKKILMYNVSGVTEEKRDGRRTKKKNGKLKAENKIVDGVFYFTPPISPRRSDEYVPEYELLDSPYEAKCVGKAADEMMKLVEQYSTPENSIDKSQNHKFCDCSNETTGIMKADELVERRKDLEEARQKLIESKPQEERWRIALKDAALMDYFTQPEDNTSCRLPYTRNGRSTRKPRRLKMVRPVCECKYERKILERNEERAKWKARQSRLKTLKKQSFMHVVGTSRPMVPETKLIISAVKTIPREDEYADDVKYCITGVAENLSMSQPQKIVDGLKISTPFETPESSKESLLPDAPHHHWSPTDIPPGPLPRKPAVLKKEMERRKKLTDEAFKLIYGDKSEPNACSSACHDYEKAYIQEELTKKIDAKKSDTNAKKTFVTSTALSLSNANKIRGKERKQNVLREETAVKKRKYSEEAAAEISHRQEKPIENSQAIEKTENNDERTNSEGDRRYPAGKLDLMAIAEIELKKMRAEGYIFATLPKCHLMPQLRDWIMYREGIAFSESEKNSLMLETITAWQYMKMRRAARNIKAPALDMTKRQLERLTYDRAEEIKKKIAEEKAIFHSKTRKSRVSYAHSIWDTMEFGKFPSASFKKAFFTYMASKETDGQVYKPWKRTEVRKRDLKFCC